MATAQSKSYIIWSIAGLIILAALIVGLSSRSVAPVVVSPAPHPAPPAPLLGMQPPVKPTPPAQAPRLDVVFTIDATGSMGDEIEVVKREVWNIADRLMQGNPRPDIRFGLVFYQDRGDSFLVQRTELTRDVNAIQAELMKVRADGGGDWQEHVGRGLHEALSLDWDRAQGVTRMIYLVGDAPGHDDYNDGYDIAGAVRIAREKQITIHTLGCSGLNSGQEEFARIARETGGTYQPLTYQAVVTGDDGVRRSVIYHNGTAYEADGVLEKADWGRGGETLLRENKLRPARPDVARKAAGPGASTENNLDSMIDGGVKDAAEAQGVVY